MVKIKVHVLNATHMLVSGDLRQAMREHWHLLHQYIYHNHSMHILQLSASDLPVILVSRQRGNQAEIESCPDKIECNTF